jgi:hypothetical protein
MMDTTFEPQSRLTSTLVNTPSGRDVPEWWDSRPFDARSWRMAVLPSQRPRRCRQEGAGVSLRLPRPDDGGGSATPRRQRSTLRSRTCE